MFGFNKKPEKKTVPKIGLVEETTREGIHKAYIPKFLYKPPFGYPRNENLVAIRNLARSPYIEMAISTIIEEVAGIDWNLVPEEGYEFESDDPSPDKKIIKKELVEHVRRFLQNPNTNNERFEDVFIRTALRDIIEVDSGVLVKVFNRKGEMVEVISRDGASFLKSPDIYGMFTDKVDIITPQEKQQFRDRFVTSPLEEMGLTNHIVDEAAYYQYGYFTGPAPIPFGRREIIWMEQRQRSYEMYGISPIVVLFDILRLLKYAIESDVEYFNNNNVPKGFYFLKGADNDALQSFIDQMKTQMYVDDGIGGVKKQMHATPVINVDSGFQQIELTSNDLQMLEKQKWYAKIIWSVLGVTPTELGITEDAHGTSNQIIQSKVSRKKSIYPLLRILENKIDTQIIPEFGDEYHNIKLRFNIFDIDEEKSKYELYETQIKNGVKTINEIRKEEGLDPLDWGNDPPKDWQVSDTQNVFNVDSKPFKDGRKPKDNDPDMLNKEKNSRNTEDKSLTTSEPIVPKEFEEIEKGLDNPEEYLDDKSLLEIKGGDGRTYEEIVMDLSRQIEERTKNIIKQHRNGKN